MGHASQITKLVTAVLGTLLVWYKVLNEREELIARRARRQSRI